MIIIQTPNSTLTMTPLDESWKDKMDILVSEIDSSLIDHPHVVVFGKPGRQRRSIGFFSDAVSGYKYSGQVAPANPMTVHLTELLDYINTLFHSTFNSVLVNKYANGEDTIGAHSDDEHSLDTKAGVLCISVGAVRTFRIRARKDVQIGDIKIEERYRGKTKNIIADVPTIPYHIFMYARRISA